MLFHQRLHICFVLDMKLSAIIKMLQLSGRKYPEAIGGMVGIQNKIILFLTNHR